ELGFTQGSQVDDLDVEGFELVQQHLGVVLGHPRTEADLGQAPLQRHLAAFEAGLDLAFAGACEGALVAAAAGLAESGTDAATDADAVLAGAVSRLESVHAHVVFSLARGI